jgi:hypothetical protein
VARPTPLLHISQCVDTAIRASLLSLLAGRLLVALRPLDASVGFLRLLVPIGGAGSESGPQPCRGAFGLPGSFSSLPAEARSRQATQ